MTNRIEAAIQSELSRMKGATQTDAILALDNLNDHGITAYEVAFHLGRYRSHTTLSSTLARWASKAGGHADAQLTPSEYLTRTLAA